MDDLIDGMGSKLFWVWESGEFRREGFVEGHLCFRCFAVNESSRRNLRAGEELAGGRTPKALARCEFGGAGWWAAVTSATASQCNSKPVGPRPARPEDVITFA